MFFGKKDKKENEEVKNENTVDVEKTVENDNSEKEKSFDFTSDLDNKEESNEFEESSNSNDSTDAEESTVQKTNDDNDKIINLSEVTSHHKDVEKAKMEALKDAKVLEEVKEIKKQEKKEYKEKHPKTQFVKNPLKNYTFWFKIIGGVVLLAFTIAMIFSSTKNDAGEVVYLRDQLAVGVFGGLILVYAVIRVIPLFKTLEKGWSKFLNIIEVLIDVVVGAMLISGGFNFSQENSNYASFVIKNFRYFLGAVLYIRGLIYCITSIIFGEKSDGKQFAANILCLTAGVAIFCLEKFEVKYLAFIMLFLSGLSGAYLVGEGGYNYIKYRNQFAENRDKKSKAKETNAEKGEKSKDKEAEKKEDEQREDVPNISPEIIQDNNNQDSTNLPN